MEYQGDLEEAPPVTRGALLLLCFLTSDKVNPNNRFDEWECYKLSDCDFDKQCQGTPGRCIDPCTNNVNTGDIVTTQTL